MSRPDKVYFDGALIPWSDAHVPAWSDATLRALSVFEGIQVAAQETGGWAVVEIDAHYARLRQSAEILEIDGIPTFEQFKAACSIAAQEYLREGQDLYLRPTLFGGVDGRTVLFIPAFPQDENREDVPLKLQTSTWQRPLDVAYPAIAKAAANYQISRLARLDAEKAGCDDAILLNAYGRVAEACGAAVVMETAEGLVTPPPSEGALASITIDVVERFARHRGIPFTRRPVSRSELYSARSISLCGTLHELQLVHAIDGRSVRETGTLISGLRSEVRLAIRQVSGSELIHGEEWPKPEEG